MESDEEYGADLLRTLDRDPVGPPAVDVRRAIAAGERQRLRVAVTTTAAAVVAAGLVVGATVAIVDRRGPATPVAAGPTGSGARDAGGQPGPSAPTGCTLAPLPLPAGQGKMSVVSGADPSGRYVLGRSYPTGDDNHPVLIWDKGQAHTVTMSGTDQELTDINTAGTAVGTSYQGTGAMAWAYQGGRFTRLAGANATAAGINEHGVIAGSVDDKPAMWRSASARPTMLNLPSGGQSGAATGIDEDGTMVGWVLGHGRDRVGYEWLPDGTGRELTTPTADGKPIANFSASAIRDGWVVGLAGTAGNPVGVGKPADAGKPGEVGYTVRWKLGTGEVDVTPNPHKGLIEAVNPRGWTVGDSGVPDNHPQLTAGGKQISLPDLGINDEVENTAYTISDDGQTLAGQVVSPGGQPVAVEWHCH